MPALERLTGTRVVATPETIDRLEAPPDAIVLRFAPDDAFIVGAPSGAIRVDDGDAIVEDEAGFVGRWLTAAEVAEIVVPHLEWRLPNERPALAQGSIAGVPAKLWLSAGPGGRDGALILTAAPFGHELGERLR